MNKFEITKLDKRHTGHQVFSHYIEPSYKNLYISKAEKVKHFIHMRNWFNSKFGLGVERNIALDFLVSEGDVVEWAWHTEHGEYRIYMSEKVYSFYILTWS